MRPVLYAGVPSGLGRSAVRELVTGNLVVLLSIAVTIPDIFNFRSLHTDAGDQAAAFAAVATGVYIVSYGLLALGRRWLAICVFTNAVLWVLAVNIILVGTDVGNQYYFVIVGVGVAFVWPQTYAYMRYIHAAIGLLAFVGVMLVAKPHPLGEPALPTTVTTPLMLAHATSAYAIAIGFVIYSLWLTHRAESALEMERQRSEELLQREVAYQVAERSKELGATLARGGATVVGRALSPGDEFADRYRIVDGIGTGAMGAVYEVERTTDSMRLALKTVTTDASAASAARFAREAEIGARVRHANVIPIVDVGVSHGVPFLVMELVRGGTLEHRRHRFGDFAWGLALLRQITDGLAALHSAGVVHRDLKPSNVLLAGDAVTETAKISDFGISRFNAFAGGDLPSSRLTNTGAMLGTPLYMAPEVGGVATPHTSADIFALGVVAFELLCGRFPFAAPPIVLALSGRLMEPAIDRDELPSTLREALRACLAEDPTRRPSVGELQDELRRTHRLRTPA